MAVVSCALIDDDAAVDDGKPIYTAKYRVVTDTRNQPAPSVYYGAQSALPDPLPAYYSTYLLGGFADVNVFAKGAKIKRIKSDGSLGTRWEIDITWSPQEPNDREQTHDDNPLTEPVRRWIEFEDIQEPIEKARNIEALTGLGRAAETEGPIQDAAGGEPSSPLMRTRRVPVLCARKNYATLDEIIAIEATYGNTVSNATYKGAAARHAAYRSIECSQPQIGGGIEYYTGVIRIAFKNSEWYFPMVNRGFAYFNDAGELVEATVKDKDGNKVPSAQPVLLQLDGKRLPDGEIGTVINWLTESEANYSTLGV